MRVPVSVHGFLVERGGQAAILFFLENKIKVPRKDRIMLFQLHGEVDG